MKATPENPPTKRSRKRRAARRPRMRWGRLIFCILIFAVIAVVGLASGTIVAVSHNLPNIDAMRPAQLGQNTVIYDRHGQRIAELYGAVNRVVVKSNQIPAVMKNATVAIEDKRFYQHHGVDFQAIMRAALADLRSGRTLQGGSTITEQYVKNAYLDGDTTLTRKVHEAILAWQLEDRWSKDRILTAYLNTVYYGNGAYGVQAAAQTYFHKNVWQLSLAQCALLAGLPRDPTGYSPIYDPADALERRDLVLTAMREQGYVGAPQVAAARAVQLHVFATPPPSQKGPAAYFVQYVTEQLIRRFGVAQALQGGLRVYTSLDVRMQNDASKALKSTLPKGPAGALVSIDPANGFIRAMVASTDYRTTQFNLTWQAHRQLGSAMKPFALVAAVEAGADPATTYYDSMPLHLDLGPGAVPPFWNVSTFSNTYAGPINLVQATWQSDNTVYAQLALDLGPGKIVTVAHRMGISSPLRPYPSIVLGSEVVNPLEVADAYATFAAEGVRHAPQAIEKVVLPGGAVQRTATPGHRAIPAGVAYVVDKILEGNTRYGTAAAMPSYYAGVAAGKTGTTTNSADAWFCGFDPKLATAVWMGYPQAEVPMPGVQGATYCVPIWGRYYEMVFGSQAVADFRQPAVMPVYRPWTGSHAAGSPAPAPTAPSASPSASPSATPQATAPPATAPTTRPTGTATPTAAPAPSPT